MNTDDVYAQAASVAQQSGVDPAIIATIASTESNLALSPPFTLGITAAASRGGAGSSGLTLGTSTPGAEAAGQPARFWAYNDGAEASIAFAQYIDAYQPALAPLLGDAAAFFDPSGPILNSHYYVPMAGGTSAADYYAHWQAVASSFGGGGAVSAGGVQTSAQPAVKLSPLVAIGAVALALWAAGF